MGIGHIMDDLTIAAALPNHLILIFMGPAGGREPPFPLPLHALSLAYGADGPTAQWAGMLELPVAYHSTWTYRSPAVGQGRGTGKVNAIVQADCDRTRRIRCAIKLVHALAHKQEISLQPKSHLLVVLLLLRPEVAPACNW